MFINCPICGAENHEDSQYCNLCFTTAGFSEPQNITDLRGATYFQKTPLNSVTERAIEYMNEMQAIEEGYALTADMVEIGVKGEITGQAVDEIVPYSPLEGSWLAGVREYEHEETLVFQETCEYPDYPYMKKII